jgi:UDP-2,4-diacetamido-2,4,6-trideoxy-beta-L-altropyranose hydrolase
MNKKLIIRADAITDIGTGHIMRCIALAQAWKDQGGNVTFLSRCDSKNLQQRINNEGFEFIPIEKPHPDSYDLGHTLEILEQLKIQNSKFKTWVVIDGYHFTPDYQKAIIENGYRLLVIDDTAHLDHYHADILLNQNIHALSLRYSCDRDTLKLLGCEYVLLRSEFLNYKDWKRVIPDKAKKILVTMGGSDPDNVTLKVIRALNSLNDPDLEVKIVAGPANPNISSLEKELYLSPFTVHLLSSVSNMPELMAWADIAISAGGSTCWEIAFMRLPSLIITTADNQANIVKELGNARAIIDLGWHKNISMEQYRRVFKEISQDRSKRSYLSKKGQKLVNGKGVMEIIKAMLVGQIKLRRVQENDCKLFWKWANDPETRAASFSPVPIPWEDHAYWFNSKLNSANCMMYIAILDDGIPLGQIRYDIKQENAVISISIDSKFRSKGYGAVLIRETSKRLFNESDVRRVHAYVKQDNNSSASVFTKAGFKKFELTTLHAQQATHFVLERFTS